MSEVPTYSDGSPREVFDRIPHPDPPPVGSRVAVAMSGGVDSSVTAALLVEAGYDVVGFTMHVYDAPPGRAASRSCCAPVDVADALRVADQLGIPHRTLDLRERFARDVVDEYASEYGRGRTPNPCVRCNQRLKYTALTSAAKAVSAGTLATGHYARVVRAPDGSLRLARGEDRAKDQSYFLFTLGQRELTVALFPLGGMSKEQVRRHGRRLGVATADKPESMETCFVPDGDHAGFVARWLGPEATPPAGAIVDRGGRVLGSHAGIHRFTVGQRRGLHVAAGVPMYVLELDVERAQIVVGPRAELGVHTALVDELYWATGEGVAAPTRARVQIRHRHRAVPATIEPAPSGCATVRFDQPEDAVTPGQAAVFYQQCTDVGKPSTILGGGFIREARRS